jgi:hypothetical protein
LPVLAFCGGVLLASAALARPQQHDAALSTQDYIDIQQLYARYYTAIDSGKGEAWADTFVPDGVFNELKGRDALVNLVNDYYRNGGGVDAPSLAHEPGHHADGGRRDGQRVPDAGGREDRQPVIYSHSHYDDVMVKTPRGWLFKSRIRRESTLNN